MINYANKLILAPMVRVGTLPMRLLALENGADLVFTPEIVDKRIIGSTRVVNDNGTIDYVKNGALNFRTYPSAEKGRLVFQMGTADAALALQAAMTVAQDVDAIDVNCGCPKPFSVHSGMGAALLTNQERLKEILTNLVQNCGLPVTCKIRIFDSLEDTLSLCRMVESTGIKALTVHCRTRAERPNQKGHWDVFRSIVDALRIPVIANGDIYLHEDIQKVKDLSGVSSVMIARGAQWNPSVFRKEGPLPKEEMVVRYLKKCIETDNPYPNTKYTVMQMADSKMKKEYQAMQSAKDYPTMCGIYNLVDYYNEWKERNPPAQTSTNPSTPSPTDPPAASAASVSPNTLETTQAVETAIPKSHPQQPAAKELTYGVTEDEQMLNPDGNPSKIQKREHPITTNDDDVTSTEGLTREEEGGIYRRVTTVTGEATNGVTEDDGTGDANDKPSKKQKLEHSETR